jgi:TatD DNase family protein
MLIDTHCHIHEPDFPIDVETAIAAANAADVRKILVVGTDMASSDAAVEFAKNHDNIWSVIGVHPHESKHGIDGLEKLVDNDKVVGIGEIGLDYYYNHSPRDIQIEILNQQIELAIKHDLPISFHVREAFDDFWPIVDNFGGKARGVIHSFTDNVANLERSLERDFLIGVNGIATFNKDPIQHEMYQRIPLERMILETDAPFLAPKPYRGKTNQPAYIKEIAQSIAQLNGKNLEEVAETTTKNAERLFGI